VELATNYSDLKVVRLFGASSSWIGGWPIVVTPLSPGGLETASKINIWLKVESAETAARASIRTTTQVISVSVAAGSVAVNISKANNLMTPTNKKLTRNISFE